MIVHVFQNYLDVHHLKVNTLNVKFIFDGKIRVIPTKMFHEQLDKDKFESISFAVKLHNQLIKSKVSDCIEYAVKYLQKEIPNNIGIACCQSCRQI